ncbi:MAG: hypothetical protein EOP85_06530 [Verrucomicrobiaceae bacterium]|nr:MAG: hypothetical protein EOP85_06530 [Verrucomicrobiaceae bacterium]
MTTGDDLEDAIACGQCRAELATWHLHHGATGVSHDLCDACHQELFPHEESIRTVRCRYCGGPPFSGSTDTLAMITGGPPEMRWMCAPCSAEYLATHHAACTELLGGPMRGKKNGPDQADFSKGPSSSTLSPSEQVEQLRSIHDRVERHMRDYVRMRDN